MILSEFYIHDDPVKKTFWPLIDTLILIGSRSSTASECEPESLYGRGEGGTAQGSTPR